MRLEEMSFSEQQDAIKFAYLRLRRLQFESEMSKFYVQETNHAHLLEELSLMLNWSLSQLDEEEQRIIKVEFANEKFDKDWWMEYYARSTYYRLKAKAMYKFLDCLHTRKMVL